LAIVKALSHLKEIVHPKMKISPCFTLGVCDILLSDEYNLSYIKKCAGSLEFITRLNWIIKGQQQRHWFMK